jgi:hypothetical protein
MTLDRQAMTPEQRTAFIADRRRRLALGDRVERLVKPIARALRLKCLDENGNLKPESGCAKRRDAMNRLVH